MCTYLCSRLYLLRIRLHVYNRLYLLLFALIFWPTYIYLLSVFTPVFIFIFYTFAVVCKCQRSSLLQMLNMWAIKLQLSAFTLVFKFTVVCINTYLFLILWTTYLDTVWTLLFYGPHIYNYLHLLPFLFL